MPVTGEMFRAKIEPWRLGDRTHRGRGKQLGLAVVTALIAIGGCQSSKTPVNPQGHITIKRLALLYGQFVGESGGRAPKDEEQFRKFVEKYKSRVRVAVESPEDLFISPRDGKPYIIVYGDEAKKHLRSGLAIYEQEGVDGLRQVAFTIGMVDEIDDASLQKLLSGNSQ